MDNPSRKSGQETSPHEAPAAAVSTPAQAQAAERGTPSRAHHRPSAAFEDAYAEFFHEVNEPLRKALESQRAAYDEYVQSVNGIYEEGCRRLEEASRNYLQELQRSQEDEEAQQRALDAYQKLTETQQAPFGPDDYLRLADAHTAFRQAVANSYDPKAVRGHSQEAFRRYLHAVKRAWAQVDPDALDAQSLAAISNTLGVIASNFAER